MKIRESAEDYLEAILMLSKKGGSVRSVDIATMLEVSKPSVSHAMKLLREDGYIAMDRYGTVTLLDKGEVIASRIYERHTVITNLLMALGVDSDTARADACKIEHAISQESFDKIKEHFLKNGGEIV
ncbi:MAG: metal-dependent transcriptional regulator [Eubacteriales bacterium]|nr:metal-dependent transcriptional regulator [Eubacteriales bacterium]